MTSRAFDEAAATFIKRLTGLDFTRSDYDEFRTSAKWASARLQTSPPRLSARTLFRSAPTRPDLACGAPTRHPRWGGSRMHRPSKCSQTFTTG
jgi:hypothetical protein